MIVDHLPQIAMKALRADARQTGWGGTVRLGALIGAGRAGYRRGVAFGTGPADLRASDADRERVAAMLGEAAADGRLTLAEHADRIERAYAARTLGELAGLTADLAAPSAQPIRVDTRRPVTGIFGSDRRSGRWVVPAKLAGRRHLRHRHAGPAGRAAVRAGRVTILAALLGRPARADGARRASRSRSPGRTILSRTRYRGGPLPAPGAGIPVVEVRTFGAGAGSRSWRRPGRGAACCAGCAR